jgi:pyruvate, water dikinase
MVMKGGFTSSSRYVIPLARCSPEISNEVGGKALGLYKLIASGVKVPKGYCISSNALRDLLVHNNVDIDKHLATIDKISDAGVEIETLEDIYHKIEDEILSLEFSRPLREDLISVYNELVNEAEALVIRSSALLEDTSTLSFAGQHATFLGITDIEDMFASIKKVWASYYTPRALSYRLRSGLDHTPKIAVIIQSLVNATKSGVIFTMDPVSGDRSKLLIESIWGLGEGLVSGEITPDQYKIDKITLIIEKRVISPKPYAYIFSDNYKKVIKRETERLQNQPSLTESEVIKLSEDAKMIEKHMKQYLDIEWAGKKDNDKVTFYFIQARPITAFKTSGEGTEYERLDLLSSVTHAVMKRYSLKFDVT